VKGAERRRQAEDILRAGLEAIRGTSTGPGGHYAEIVERAIHSIALLSPDGVILEANAQAVRTLNAPREDLLGVALWDAPAWKDLAEGKPRLRAALSAARHGVLVHQESELPGTPHPIALDLSLNPVHGADGAVALIVAEWRDVSDRRRAEAALRESEERFHRIVSIAVDAIISIDEAQNITLFNQGAEQIFGYPAHEVLGKPLEVLLPRELAGLHVKEVRAFGEGKEDARRMGQRRQIFGRRKNGEIFSAEASISRATVGGRRIYTAVLRDVTERWATEQEKTELLAATQHARDVAERAVAQRDEMLSIVSHDLRNPLSAIGMCATAIAADDTTPGDRERLTDTIQESVEWCQHLIADLVDIASIEADKLSIDKRRIDPLLAVGRTLSLFELPASRRSIALRAGGQETLPPIDADPERLFQVLANLVANAIKFTADGGSVTVGANQQDGEVVFFVEDTGVGIPPDQLPHVFERRWRGTAKGTDPGTGLGLTISRGIVEAHGGRIRATSTPGVGSRFEFTLGRTPS
jgi:PAS domain S-box-containing protein